MIVAKASKIVTYQGRTYMSFKSRITIWISNAKIDHKISTRYFGIRKPPKIF